MDLVRILGWNVRARRRQLGISQEELAYEAGMKRSYLSDLERGTRNPSVRAVERLAIALKVPPGDLLAAPAPEPNAGLSDTPP
ncbi:helix-turn-helix transcriptional regulator [Phenylobacterium sp.]|uniref:helix-turn-helix domain-containing protein n=1 Tax=Phenylobacterium sp. TaxID=1871053 RepID=UPI0028113B43|nr:helix-turn-helix transcriptional regulator [Phenylobacterium sp.]